MIVPLIFLDQEVSFSSHSMAQGHTVPVESTLYGPLCCTTNDGNLKFYTMHMPKLTLIILLTMSMVVKFMFLTI